MGYRRLEWETGDWYGRQNPIYGRLEKGDGRCEKGNRIYKMGEDKQET